MKRVISAALAALACLSLYSCGGEPSDISSFSSDTEEGTAVQTQAKEPPVEYSADSFSLIGKGGVYTREGIEVPAAEKYMFSANVKVEKRSSGGSIGLCAAINTQGQILELLNMAGGELSSCASLYGSELRSDLGQIKTGVKAYSSEFSMTVIRDGDLFYLINGEKLCQIREFTCYATVPGFSVMNASASFADISYTSDTEKIDSAIALYKKDFEGYGIGDLYANFGAVTINGASSFTVSEALMKKGMEYTRIAFDGSYCGDMEVTFTASGLKALSSADSGGDIMCRLRFLIHSENDVTDMICLGVANKQDRIETFAYYDIAQWYYHADLTGDNRYFDWNAENEFRIVITATENGYTYTVYVNGALFAMRTALSSGSLRFGFEAENVYGTVSNFKVTGGKAQ